MTSSITRMYVVACVLSVAVGKEPICKKMESKPVCTTPRVMSKETFLKEEVPTRKIKKTWHVLETDYSLPSELVATEIQPVESGLWLGGRSFKVAFFDYKKGGVTIILEKGGNGWSAAGHLALVVQPDRRGLIYVDAKSQKAGILEEVPKTAYYFDNIGLYEHRFYISSPYNPLWIYEPFTATWTGIELDYVRDSDFERLGSCYYTPSMDEFVIDKSGEIWGFQGTRDALRGNAVCHYVVADGKWEQFEFPWETTRGDDYHPVGVTESFVWFASGRHRTLLLDKKTHRWKRFELDLLRAGELAFCESGLFVTSGDKVYRFEEASSKWKLLELGGLSEGILTIAERNGALYLSTTAGIKLFPDYLKKLPSEQRLVSCKILPVCKWYGLVLTDKTDPSMADTGRICDAIKRGDVDAVKSSIAKGVDLTATIDTRGFTPLHLAVEAGHMDIIRLLLESGVEVNIKSTYGWTPLKIAAREGHLEIADYLISKGGKKR